MIKLKEYFNVDCKYDWESKEFVERSVELLQEASQYGFFESSPSRNKNFEKQLSDISKMDTEN